MKIEQSSFFDKFVRNIKKGKSFTLTGLTIFSRLLLLKYIFKLSGKKVLFITSTEQSALKYSSDLERLFELTSETLPYQNTSPYEVVTGNLYDYARQVNTLLNLPDIVIAPAKVLLEKFPSNTFFENNSFKLKVGESIDQKNLLSRLIKLGYKRSTMVSDIGEFSIRGDIADIYSLEENPVRVEFWGDEIIDIRFFNNETQKSIEKIKEITIEPLYKFILPDSTPEDFPKELQEQLDNEGYFEGVNVYQSYFNNDLVSVLDYFKDYIIVFDEYAEVSAKYQQIDDNFVNNYNEGLKTQNIHPLKEINHFTLAETLNRTAGMQKIYFNNFLSDENNEVIDIDARNVQVFDADMDEAAKFLKEHKGYQITIATDYQERVKEVLSDYDIFDINFIKNITSQGTEIQDGKILLLTDRELFNKRQKEVPSNRKRHYKEKAEYIESINDIKEGEYVVHSIHGVGVYKGLTKQEFDGQLKDYLTIEYANKDKLHIPAEQINMLCRYRGSGQVKPKLSRMGGSDWENTKTRVKKEVETMIREEGEEAALEVGVHGIHPELIRLLGKMKFRTSYGQNALKHSIEVAQLSGLLAAELGLDVRLAKRAGLLHDIGKAVDHEMEGSHIQLGAELCRKYKESATVINAVESHHGDVEPTSLIACIVQAADTISAARPGARRETLETYTSRLKQLEDISNNFKGVDKSFAIQAGREVRVMVVPEQISDADMVLLARDISKQIEAELEYPGQIKVNVIRESRVTDYAK